MRTPSLPLLAVLLLSARAASAQETLPGEPPTRGPEIPAGAIAGDAEATQVVLDAANLGFLSSWNLVGLYTYLDRDGARGPGGGGLYFAAPLPLLDRLVLGGSIELVRPPHAFPYGDIARLSLAAGVRLLRDLSLGLTWGHVFTGDTPGSSHGIDTLDLSISTRLGRYLAAAAVVRDVPAPQFQGLGIQRVYQAELSLRPLGNHRLELAPAAFVGERRGDWGASLRIRGSVYPGVTLVGTLAYLEDEFGGGGSARDFRASVGLQLDLAHFGFGGWVLFGNRVLGSGEGVAAQGLTVAARLSGDRYPALWTPARLERIDLKGGDERKLARRIAALARMERDRRALGIVAVIGDLDGSWATMEELRGAFRRLRRAGKHVFVYGAELTTKSYYVAAAAERIYLDPGGGLRFIGLSSTSTFFKGTLDLLSVRADFVRIAEYKSAPEQFTREAPSDEALAVRNALLDDVSNRVIAAVAADRGLEPARVRTLRDAGPFTAVEAMKAGLVDELAGGDEVEDAIGRRLGRPVDAVPPHASPARPESWERPAIAVLFVEGDIIEGRSRKVPLVDLRFVGHETIIRALETARSDPRVRSIVLRIDSPGGSALASDLISREVARTRKVKPILCSLGDTAASGGYFIAASCDYVFAEPSTVTGSIGIFSGKFDVSALAARLGVGVSTLRRGPHADVESMFRPYTDEEREHILEQLRYYYGRFVAAVAAGRRMTPEQVDAVGRGRVWSGAQARERRLVDELGGLREALREAKRRGGLDPEADAQLLALPEEPTSLLGQLGALVGGETSRAEEQEVDPGPLLRPLGSVLRALPGSLLLAPSTPQARLPFDVPLP